MNSHQKPKSLRPEQVADLVLVHLHKKAKSPAQFFLNNFLSEKNIYHDVVLLKAVAKLLLDEELVTEEKDTRTLSAFGYHPPNQTIQPGEVIPAIEMLLHPLKITSKGRHVTSQGQSLDKQGVAEAIESAKKWRERRWNFVIALITAVAVACATEPIKRFFASDKPLIKNESSAVRSSINPR